MRNSTLSALLAGILFSPWCSPVRALEVEPGNGEPNRRAAYVFVYLRPDGGVRASVTVFGSPLGEQTPIGGRQLKEAMERFLGGPVKRVGGADDDPDERPAVQRQFEVIDGVRRKGWVSYLDVDPGPLHRLLRTAGVRVLNIGINIEDKQGFSECTLPASPDREADAMERSISRSLWMAGYLSQSPFDSFSQRTEVYQYHLPVTEDPIPPFRVAYGYRPKDFWLLAPLALLLLPVLLILWRRRRVLKEPSDNPATTWWSYARLLQRLEVGLALFWAFVVLGTPVGVLLDRAAHFLVGIPTEGQSLVVAWDWLSFAVYVLPPAAVGFLCTYLSYPVYLRLRELEWTRWEMAWHAVVSHVLPWLILFLFAGMIASAGHWHRFIGWGLAGLLLAILLPRLRMFIGRRALLPLDIGVLRDRVFELAQKAGVKVNQVYLWPSSRDRTANAAAVVGHKVLLTDYLLQHMSKRQADWVVAHELVHLRHRHPGKAGAVGVLWVGLVIFYLAILYGQHVALMFPDLQSLFATLFQLRYGFMLVLFLGYLWVRNSRMRRNEFIADDEAVTITGGDAEAAVAALANLARLNRHPPQWGRLDENTATHPSDSRRIQAIMDEFEMDPEGLPAILAKLDQDEDRYPLPADLLRGERVLLTEFRARCSAVVQWLSLGLLMLLPALIARGIVSLGWHGVMAWAAFAGGIVFSLLLLTTVMGYAVVWGERRLRRRLSDQWKSAGFDVAAWPTAFVGLAPARAPRLYEGRYEWDMGFLLRTKDRLCYLGCQTRFALPRSQITAIRIGPGVPRWGKSSRVYLTWCDDEGFETTWNLRPAGTISRRALERAMPDLLRTLQAWHQKPLLSDPLPAQLSSLQTPAISKITCTTVASFLRANPVMRSVYLCALVSGGLAFLFGCPFGMVPDPGWGWYAPALAGLMVLFQRVPVWRYREPRPLK